MAFVLTLPSPEHMNSPLQEGNLWISEQAQPVLPRCHSKSLSRHFHFLCTVQAYAKGWETTSCFFYKWAQQYKNLILSPFMLPIKLQMLLLNGVPLMHIIEWVISQPPALWYYWAKCCLSPMLKKALCAEFSAAAMHEFSRASTRIESEQCRTINISS